MRDHLSSNHSWFKKKGFSKRLEVNFPNMKMGVHDVLYLLMLFLFGGRIEHLSPKITNKLEMSAFTSPAFIVLEVVASAVKQEKEIKWYSHCKRRNKIVLIHRWPGFLCRKPDRLVLDLMNKCSIVEGYRVSISIH